VSNSAPEGNTRWYTAWTSIAIFALLALLAWPAGDFPLNDDWTYAKSLLKLEKEGVIDLGTSSSALVTQLFYGLLFIKLFGFSFIALRLSTCLSVLVFVLILQRVLVLLKVSGPFAIFFTLCFVLNPIYFSLSHTFMTDVNFCTLLLCCLWCALKFHTEKRVGTFILFFIFSLLLIFLRQFGMLVPFAFLLSCLFLPQKRVQWSITALAGCMLLFLAFSRFEASAAARSSVFYHAAAQQDLLSASYWETLVDNFRQRGDVLLVNVSVWMLPLSLVLLVNLRRRAGSRLKVAALLGSSLGAFLFYGPRNFPLGNVFANMSVGAETFYESLIWPGDPFPHTFSERFLTVLQLTQVLSTFIFSYTLIIFIALLANKSITITSRPLAILLGVFLVGYSAMLFIPEMFLDRYLLPLILVLGLLALTSDAAIRITWPGFAILIPFAFVAVAGTRDYFTLNRLRWKANTHLRQDLQIPPEKINGGYEVNSWHEGQPFNWYDHTLINNHEYLVQYRPEKDFTVYRTYPFYRFLSLSGDTLCIYKRRHD
jgi:hypothetical protein